MTISVISEAVWQCFSATQKACLRRQQTRPEKIEIITKSILQFENYCNDPITAHFTNAFFFVSAQRRRDRKMRKRQKETKLLREQITNSPVEDERRRFLLLLLLFLWFHQEISTYRKGRSFCVWEFEASLKCKIGILERWRATFFRVILGRNNLLPSTFDGKIRSSLLGCFVQRFYAWKRSRISSSGSRIWPNKI